MAWRTVSALMLGLLGLFAMALRLEEDAGLWALLLVGAAAVTLPVVRGRPVPRWAAVMCAVAAGQLIIATTMIPSTPVIPDLVDAPEDDLGPRKLLTGAVVGLWALAIALGKPFTGASPS
jgi:hypothetical protein